MATEPRRVDFEYFVDNAQQILEDVRNGKGPVLVERDGVTYRLEREEESDIWRNYDPDRARNALRRAAGILKGMDTEELIADIYAQRDQDSVGRPA